MSSLENLQNRKIIGITDGEVAMPVMYNEHIQDSKYFYNCNVISLAATIARTIDKDRLFRGIFYDTSIKRPHSSTKAAEIFAIGKALFNDTTQYGIWKISAANVHQNDLVNVGWELVKRAPDKFIDAAIAFDGTWELTEDFKYYSLFTEETPWAFYVTNDNVLYYWNYRTNSVQQLDTNVMYCAAERGYSPKDYAELNSDQGIVVVYATKNQEVKYFTYSVTSGTEFKQWLGPETITTFTNETIKSVQVHRLNDYRVGVLITTDKKSYWYITDRVYSQMAFRPEIIQLPAANTNTYAAISFANNITNIYPSFSFKMSEEKDALYIITEGKFKILDDYKQALENNRRNNHTFISLNPLVEILKIEVQENQIVIILKEALQQDTILTFQPEPDIRLAVEVNDLEKQGIITIKDKLEYCFEASPRIRSEITENIIVPSANLSIVDINMYQYLSKTAINEEFITLPAANINSLSVEMHKYEDIDTNMTENIVLPAANINTLSIFDIVILHQSPV